MTLLPLSTIRFDSDCQSRVSLDEETVSDYAHRLEEGADFPPLIVFFDGSDHWLADGFHRFAAHNKVARRAGNEAAAAAPCLVRQGTRLDAVRYALSANSQHGKRREPGDYRKGYDIAIRCGLCDAADTAAVRALLACSERWARDLTAPARDAAERERNARIVAAREAGERQAKIAAREGLTQQGVAKILNNQRQPAVSCAPSAAVQKANTTTSELDFPAGASAPAPAANESHAPFDSAWSPAPGPSQAPSLDRPDDDDPADPGFNEGGEDEDGADRPVIGASISLAPHDHEREDWEDYADQINDEMAEAEEAAAQVEPVPVQPSRHAAPVEAPPAPAAAFDTASPAAPLPKPTKDPDMAGWIEWVTAVEHLARVEPNLRGWARICAGMQAGTYLPDAAAAVAALRRWIAILETPHA